MIELLTLPADERIGNHSLLIINQLGKFELAKRYEPQLDFYVSLWPRTYGHVCATRSSQVFVRVSGSRVSQGEKLAVGDVVGTVQRTKDKSEALGLASSSSFDMRETRLILVELI